MLNFEQTPHPLVEDHYSIRNLINAQEKRRDDRERHRNIDKKRDEDLKDIAGFKDIETLDFYCDKCDREFVGRAKKQIDNWQNIAYYKIKHRCGNWCLRHITDRFRDKYFFKSKKLARERYNGFNDTLQPFQSGYKMLYKK